MIFIIIIIIIIILFLRDQDKNIQVFRFLIISMLFLKT